MSSKVNKAAQKRIQKKVARSKRPSNKKPQRPNNINYHQAIASGDILAAARIAAERSKGQGTFTKEAIINHTNSIIEQIIPAHAMVEVFEHGVAKGYIESSLVSDASIESIDRSVVRIFENIEAIYKMLDAGLQPEDVAPIYMDLLQEVMHVSDQDIYPMIRALEPWSQKIEKARDEIIDQLTLDGTEEEESVSPNIRIEKLRMARVYPLYATPAETQPITPADAEE